MTHRSTQAFLLAAGLALVAAAAPARAAPSRQTPEAIPPEVLARASVGGKYAELVATFDVPEDVRTYGEFHDYGAWGGGTYRGIPNTPAGHWVYVAPRWYVWRTLAPRVPAAPPVSAAPAPTPRPGARPPETAHPHAPRDPPGPDLDGPLGAVHRYVQGKKIGIGRSELDPRAGFMVPVVRPSGGGFLFSAVRDDRTDADRELRDRDGYRVYMAGKTVPLVVKLDETGGVVWERGLQKKGFIDYGGGWVAEAKNGSYFAMVPSYVHPARSPVYRFLSLRPKTGATVWERQLRGSGGRNSPIVDVARVTERGTLALTGRIYLEPGDSTQNHWKGEISADGRLLSDRTGPVAPRLGDGPVTTAALDPRVRAWLQNAAAGSSEGFPELRPAYVHAFRNDIVLAHRSWHVAPRLGWMIPIVQASGGGTLLVGVRIEGAREAPVSDPSLARRTRPVVVKLDAAGRPEWERSLEAPRFDAYGGGLALEAPDGGYLLMIPSYELGSWGHVARFLKLDRSGEVVWERALPVVEGSGRSPEVEKVRLGDRGSLVIRGHAYVDAAFRKIHVYDGEIDAAGRLVVHRIGPVRPKPGAMQVVGPDGKPLGEGR